MALVWKLWAMLGNITRSHHTNTSIVQQIQAHVAKDYAPKGMRGAGAALRDRFSAAACSAVEAATMHTAHSEPLVRLCRAIAR